MATGRCACGAVEYRVDGELRQVIDCHCVRCRRWTGHFMAATACRATDLVISGEDRLRWWHPTEEPAVAYGSCSGCGSGLFWRSDARPDHVSITAGTLDPPTGLRTTDALFVEVASDYHALDDRLVAHPGDWPRGAPSGR